jgi:magnesium-transporting ATPase (P-type)
VFGGSIVKRGEITGIVVATGTSTFFGQTAKLVRVCLFVRPRRAGVIFSLFHVSPRLLALYLLGRCKRASQLCMCTQ